MQAKFFLLKDWIFHIKFHIKFHISQFISIEWLYTFVKNLKANIIGNYSWMKSWIAILSNIGEKIDVIMSAKFFWRYGSNTLSISCQLELIVVSIKSLINGSIFLHLVCNKKSPIFNSGCMSLTMMKSLPSRWTISLLIVKSIL